ncbi:MAG: sugar phosphate isomerase/epimerase family protein [Candidatus Limnocylindrales bacterium]
MELQLGINTCFAVKRWPRPDDWAPIVRDRLDLTLVEHSFDLVEPDDAAHLASGAAAVAEAARRHGLRVHSTFTGLAAYSANLLLHPEPAARAAALDWFRQAIAFTAAAGGAATGGHVGAFSVADWRDPARKQERWSGLQAALRELSGAAARAGLEYLLVENLAAAREPSTRAMVRELLSPADDEHAAVVLCLDVGHMCVPGTSGPERDPYVWLRELGPSAPEVQLQQSDADNDHHWPFTPERNRQGRIEADRVIDALGEGGTQACTLILEVIPPFEQDDDTVLDDLARSTDYWREALARAGVAAAI